MNIDLKKFTSYTIEQLIVALAQTKTLLVNALEQQARAQTFFDREYINHYIRSESTHHVTRDAEARHHAQNEQEDLTEFGHQVAIHTTVCDFLTNLIQWRIYGSSPRIQGSQQADPAQGGSLERVG